MKTLVIIDDEIFFRKSLINFLEKQNIYNIAGEANNGQAGIQLIENVKPDIALVDISMPVMSGLDMMQLLEQTVIPDSSFPQDTKILTMPKKPSLFRSADTS